MDIASGMACLHSLGILHSDLKAANVMLKAAQPSTHDPRGFTCRVWPLLKLLSHLSSFA